MRITMFLKNRPYRTEVEEYYAEPNDERVKFATLDITSEGDTICIHFGSLEDIEEFLAQATLDVEAKLGAKEEDLTLS